MKSESGSGSQKPDPSSSEPTPFEKFDAFTRRIMAVPKSEIDAKEAEHKAKQATDKSAKAK